MFSPHGRLDAIRRDLSSAEQSKRVAAMQGLVLWAATDADSTPKRLGLLAGLFVLFLGVVRTPAQRICFALGWFFCATFLAAVVTGWIR